MVAIASLAALVAAGSAQASYTVRPGDSLGHIAERQGTSVSALMQANGIVDPDRIRAGDDLVIPTGDTATFTAGAGGPTHHVVAPGETLSTIAQRYGITPDEIREWNGMSDMGPVWSGSRLSVSGPAAPDLTSAAGERTHEVARGETLSHLAIRYGVSVDDLVEHNGLADPGGIVAGTTLNIGGSGGWHCPVTGPVSFVNDFGIGKPSGRFHNGVDLHARLGTPVVAPVAGHVEHRTGVRAGLQFTLTGVDGHTYVGTHLDAFGAAGRVRAGEVIGTVGSSGNARGTPAHLHFEIHLDGVRIGNPHPSLLSACG